MDRVTSRAAVLALAAQARRDGRQVILTNGAFDLLHVGHVRYLGAAREIDPEALMVVAINGDAWVTRTKGSDRPIMPAEERAEIVSALQGVDCVLIFEEDTVDSLIAELRPDVHAKGTDYTEANVPEREAVLAVGGRVVIVGDPKQHSSSGMMKRARGGT
jgi:rfaE bifunctional protein nucleotidyltransferase chain/domain